MSVVCITDLIAMPQSIIKFYCWKYNWNSISSIFFYKCYWNFLGNINFIQSRKPSI